MAIKANEERFYWLELSVRLLNLKKLVKCYFDRNTFFSKNNLLELILDEILHLSMVCPIRLPHFLYSSAQTAMMVSWWEERVSWFNVRRSTFSEENCFTRLHSIKSLEIRVLWTAIHIQCLFEAHSCREFDKWRQIHKSWFSDLANV